MHGELLVAKLRARYPELNPTPGTVPSGTIASPYSVDIYLRISLHREAPRWRASLFGAALPVAPAHTTHSPRAPVRREALCATATLVRTRMSSEDSNEPTALREVLEGLALSSRDKPSSGGGGGSASDAAPSHAFWDTQPVPRLGEETSGCASDPECMGPKLSGHNEGQSPFKSQYL